MMSLESELDLELVALPCYFPESTSELGFFMMHHFTVVVF